MSIILKALKKAEESKVESEKEDIKRTHMYQIHSKKILWIVLVGFIGIVLIFSIGIYRFKSKGKTVLPTPKKAVENVLDVQRSPEPKKKEKTKTAESLEVEKLHKEAIQKIKEKNYPDAENIIRKAILMKPDDAVMYNHLGLALKNQGQYKEASVVYEKAIKLKPDYHEAMNNLAVTYEMRGDKEKAKKLYEKALSIKPSYAEAHLNYALLLEAEENNAEAESHYHTFLNLSTDADLKAKVKERLKGLRR